MSKVALIVGDFGESKVKVVKLFRAHLGLELGKILEFAGSGRPILEKKLFDRSNPEFASCLQVVLSGLEELGVPYEAYEVLDQQQFVIQDSAKYFRLDAKKLKNILNSEVELIQQQIELGALEDGEESSD